MVREMPDDPFALLTTREMQCLEGLRDRLDVREISDRLGITINTVNTYLDGARRKLEAPTRNAAVKMLIERDQPLSKSISGFREVEPGGPVLPSEPSRGSDEQRGQGTMVDADETSQPTPRRRSLPMPFPTRERRRNDLAIGQLLVLIVTIAIGAVLVGAILIQTLIGLGTLGTSLHNLL